MRKTARLFLALLLVACASARATEYDDVSVTCESPPVGPTSHGYVPYRVTIVNRDASRAHRVTVAFPAESHGSSWEYLERAQRSVTVAAKASAVVALPIPALPINSQNLRVAIDGSWQEEIVNTSGSEHGRLPWYGSGNIAVLHGRDLATMRNLTDKIFEFSGGGTYYTPGSHGPPTKPLTLLAGYGEVRQWPDQWLAYSCYDGIVLTAAELARMPGSVRDALWQYVTAGGVLTVVGGRITDVPQPWRSGGHGQPLAQQVGVGFGLCHLYPGATPADITRPQWEDQYLTWQATRQFCESNVDVVSANAALPVVEKLAIPARTLFVLMIGFAVVIGPINLFWLARRDKRMWLLWTVPVASVGASVVVLGYSLASEGWRGSGRTQVVTLLDQVNQQATTLGWTGYYAPLTPRGGLHFGADTEVTPQIYNPHHSYNSVGSPRTVDWTHEQHLASGWISARVPAHFRIRRVEPRRERLAFTSDDAGGWRVVNGLGARIGELSYRDSEGRLFTARDVAPGAQAEMKVSPEAKGSGMRSITPAAYVRPMFCGDWRVAAPPSSPVRGSYVAVTDQTPFLAPALANLREHRVSAIVVGIVDDARAASSATAPATQP